MAKLYFKYGAMGSSKSAQALITQFNYEELGMTVWLIKPSVDDRDGANIIRSRIGLQREAQVIHPDEDIIATFARAGHADVIIADEAQFFSPEQIDQLRRIVDEQNIQSCRSAQAAFPSASTAIPAGSSARTTQSTRSNTSAQPTGSQTASESCCFRKNNDFSVRRACYV